jgi:uncharacterized lipoprotein YbaY/heat shock protein HslJ
MVLRLALRWVEVVLPMCLLCACAGTPQSPDSSLVVTGTATYRERIALAPQAVFEASVEDVSRADAPSTRIGHVRVDSPRVPVRFSIPVDAALVAPDRRYVVRARITLDGRMLFTSDIAYPVLDASGTKHVDMLLRSVAAAPGAATPRRMQGHYSYMADAALFVDCASGQRLPVAEEGDNAALQRAYAAARPSPGAPMLVTVDAIVQPRPSPEAGRPPRPVLAVARYVAIGAGPCGTPHGNAVLENTYWRLVALRDRPVEAAERQREAHVILQPQQRRLVGSGGCNRIAGSYSLEGEQLSFGRSAGTLMACPRGMEQERDFLAALAATARWRIVAEQLDLLDAAGTTVARFEAVHLR